MRISDWSSDVCSSDLDLDRALKAAHDALPIWRATTPNKRALILREAARWIRHNSESIGLWVAAEVGKPRRQGEIEAEVAAETLEWFAEEGRRTYGRIVPGEFDGAQFSVVKEPVGVSVALADRKSTRLNSSH